MAVVDIVSVVDCYSVLLSHELELKYFNFYELSHGFELSIHLFIHSFIYSYIRDSSWSFSFIIIIIIQKKVDKFLSLFFSSGYLNKFPEPPPRVH